MRNLFSPTSFPNDFFAPRSFVIVLLEKEWTPYPQTFLPHGDHKITETFSPEDGLTPSFSDPEYEATDPVTRRQPHWNAWVIYTPILVGDEPQALGRI